MADKEKKASSKKAEETVSDETKAAEKVAKAAKGSGKNKDKPNVFVRMGRSTKRFFKDFKGESKKIVWPDAKTVLKSTGVVILVVAICSLIIFGIDTGLSSGISGLKSLATGDEETTVSDVADDEETEDEDASEAEESEDESESEETEAETTAESEAETTEAETAAE